ncbi:hypothetical protein [Roseiflexus sp.]|uniref:hypothetical protein n=1 Tax=Roseiflexus sp. TaxID=2562120 RepID=UPI00398B309B
MANVSTNPLGFLFGSSNAEAKEITTDIIKIRNGTILLRNKIIQIRNIASVEVVSLAISFPWIVPLLILFGLGMLTTNVILGFPMSAWGAHLIYYYLNTTTRAGIILFSRC